MRKKEKKAASSGVSNKDLLANFDIHVMPKDFVGKKVKAIAKSVEPVKKVPVKKQGVAKIPPKVSKAPGVSGGKKRVRVWVFVGLGVAVLVVGFGLFGFLMMDDDAPVMVVEAPEEVDIDGDGVLNADDNCLYDANASQSDRDHDGLGDVCDDVDDSLPTEPTPGVDSDSDGLTDVEEGVYGTDARDSDSDGDSFLDGNEVFHGYDPASDAPSTLVGVEVTKVFSADDHGFTVEHLMAWRVDDGDEGESDDRVYTFRATTGGEFTVRVLTNVDGMSLAEYVQSDGLSSFTSLLGTEGYIDQNERFVVFAGPGKFVELRYDAEDFDTIEYLQTFKLFVNSVVIDPV